MNDVVQRIQTSENVAELKQILEKNKQLIESVADQVEDALEMLNWSHHTYGMTFLLAVGLRAQRIKNLDAHMRSLIRDGVPFQIRLAGEQFAFCVDFWSAQYLTTPNAPLLSIVKPLELAMKKARPNSETLTTVHRCLLHVAIRAHAYHVAAAVCDETIFDVDEDGCAPRDMLLYFHYGGLAYVGLKRWKDALKFFRRVVISPVQSLSAISAEAFKKMMLVSLLANGRFDPTLPRFVSPSIQRSQKVVFSHYHDLCNAYATRSLTELEKVAAQHQEVFVVDQNMGLVKQVAKSLLRGNIRRHAQTYLTLSLANVAESAGLPVEHAQRQVLDMIGRGEIFASINGKDQTVEFLANANSYDDAAAVQELHQRLDRAISLAQRVGKLRDTIEESEDYANKQVLREKTGNGGKGPSNFADYAFDEGDTYQGDFQD